MASHLGSIAQSVATTNQATGRVQATGAFSSLRSGAEFVSYILRDVLGLDPVLIVNASLLVAAVSAFSRWLTNTLYRQAKDWGFVPANGLQWSRGGGCGGRGVVFSQTACGGRVRGVVFPRVEG